MFLIEAILIGVIILSQIAVFLTTRQNILVMKLIFPKGTALGLIDMTTTEGVASGIDGLQLQNEVLAVAEDGKLKLVPEEGAFSPKLSLILIKLFAVKWHYSPVFKRITQATNTYLVRNKNHAADFSIIRDIADREIDAQENLIQTTMSLPLYLGLLGTFIGIILGLWELVGLQGGGFANDFEQQIPSLLKAVSIAMVASFVGLLLTVILNGGIYKSALKENDIRRNEYFTFIQTELLPVLSKDMSSSLTTLQSNINLFNEKFNENISRFSNVIKATSDNIGLQRDFLEKLEVIGYDRMVNTNLVTLDKMELVVNKFEDFIDYQNSVNETLDTAKSVGIQLNALAGKFNAFEGNANELSEYIRKAYADYNVMVKYLSKNLGEVKVREDAMRKFISDLDNTFQKGTEVLQQRAAQGYGALKEFTITEIDQIARAYKDSRPNFEQLNHLKSIHEGIKLLARNGEELNGALSSIEKKFMDAEKKFMDAKKKPSSSEQQLALLVRGIEKLSDNLNKNFDRKEKRRLRRKKIFDKFRGMFNSNLL